MSYLELDDLINKLTYQAQEKGVKLLYLYEKEIPAKINLGLSRYRLDKFIIVKKSDNREEIRKNNSKFGVMLEREIYKAIAFAEEN